MRRVLEEIVQKFIDAGAKFGPEITRQMEQAEDIVKLTNQLCANMPMRWQDRQTLAEKMDFRERYEELCRIMEKEYDVLLINQDIQNKVKSRLEKNQRDYVLREQMKLIREELGDDMQSEIDEYEKKLEELKAPDVVKEKLEKEISRFKASAGNSAEPILIHCLKCHGARQAVITRILTKQRRFCERIIMDWKRSKREFSNSFPSDY